MGDRCCLSIVTCLSGDANRGLDSQENRSGPGIGQYLTDLPRVSDP